MKERQARRERERGVQLGLFWGASEERNMRRTEPVSSSAKRKYKRGQTLHASHIFLSFYIIGYHSLLLWTTLETCCCLNVRLPAFSNSFDPSHPAESQYRVGTVIQYILYCFLFPHLSGLLTLNCSTLALTCHHQL